MKLVCIMAIMLFVSSCATLFKGSSHRVIRVGGKSAPTYANKSKDAWLDLQYKDADDPINDILAMGRWSVASRKIKARLAAKPGDEQLLVLLASALFMEKKYRAARFYAGKVLRLNNKNSAALNVLGLCTLYNAKSSNEFREATMIFKRAFAASGTEVASGMNLGFLYLRAKNSFFARETFTEVIRRCKACPAAYLGLGIAHYQRSKFADAIEAFEDGLDIAANDEITFHLALVYRYGKRQLSKARDIFSKVARNHAAPRYLRNKARAEIAVIDEGQMYRYQQQPAPARDEFSDTYLMESADEDFSIQSGK